MGDLEEQRVRQGLVRSLLGSDERFAVTGASGWLGRTALDLLAGALGPEAFSARVTGFATTAKSVTLRHGLVVALRPLSELALVEPSPTHILHFAYQTRDKVATLGIGRYVVANLEITTMVLDAVQRHHPRGVFVTSTGAVYAPDGGFTTDLLANPYGSLKYQEELVLRCAAGDVGAATAVARVFSVGGAYITKPELYAMGDLVLMALAGRPLAVRAEGLVYRSYCAAADIVAMGLLCLLDPNGSRDVMFDTGGAVVELSELAERIGATLAVAYPLVERSLAADVAPDRYVGDGDQMAALASLHGLPLQSLEGQIRETAEYLRPSLGRVLAPGGFPFEL